MLVRVARHPSDHRPFLIGIGRLVMAVGLVEIGVAELSKRRHQLGMRVPEILQRLFRSLVSMQLPDRIMTASVFSSTGSCSPIPANLSPSSIRARSQGSPAPMLT